jgi:hypothetical protein
MAQRSTESTSLAPGCASWLARIHGLFIGVLRVLVISICLWVLQIVISVVLNDLYLASRSKSFWKSREPFLGPRSIQRSFSVCFLENYGGFSHNYQIQAQYYKSWTRIVQIDVASHQRCPLLSSTRATIYHRAKKEDPKKTGCSI